MVHVAIAVSIQLLASDKILSGNAKSFLMNSKRYFKLNSILGITANTPFGVENFQDQPWMLYPAGATAVLYDYERNKQIEYLHPPAPTKSISCLSLNSDNSILVMGEVCCSD
jgi:hypothetical protein